ncbi:MAG TPA: hypothetical protein ENK85_11515 [Saprospiraceae bacterium]|nr:hypothetical protein [Saprospiraceae bacterium]
MKNLLIALLVFISFFAQAQSNYYVAKNGNDTNDGSAATPWLTIQHGVNQLSQGDVLNIKAGTYFEKVDIDVSGTATNIITIKNYQNDNVIISGAQSTNNLSIIWTDNAYLRIEGLHVSDSQKNYAQGIALQETAHHIEVVNNKVSKINFSSDPNATVTSNTNAVPVSALGDAPDTGNGVPDSVHHISFIGNEVFDNRTGYSENLTIGGNVSHFLMENNIVHDNTNIAIDVTGNYGESPVAAYDHARYGTIKNNTLYNNTSPYSPAAGIYIDGGQNIVVENNLSHHNGYGGEIGCEENGATTNVIFRNNVFHHNTNAGMHFGGYDSNTTGHVTHSQIYNNTFYQNDSQHEGFGELILTQSSDCKIFNNIFYINNQNVFLYAYRTQTNLDMNYNLVYSVAGNASTIETTTDGDNNGGNAYEGLAAFYSATGYGANSLFGDPLFTDATQADFHIPSNSPATNAGDPSHNPDASEVDLDGAARAVERVDIGVDEYPIPLPVEYLSLFSGRTKSDGILLTWTTSREINAEKFIIQRLTPNDQWQDVAEIFAGQYRYQFLDSQPLTGVNIYRLKQVDLDQRSSLSEMVSILWEEPIAISLYPNPTAGTVTFSDNLTHTVMVKNILGQTVLLARNAHQIQIPAKGIYSILLMDYTGKILSSHRLIVE